MNIWWNWRYWLIFVNIYQMLNYFRFCRSCVSIRWKHLRTLTGYRFSNVIITWPWIKFLLFGRIKTLSSWFEYRMRSWNLQNLNILSLARYHNFLPILIISNVIWSRPRKCTNFMCIIFVSSLHCTKRNKCFRYSVLFSYVEFVAAGCCIMGLFGVLCFSFTSEYKSHYFTIFILKLLWNLIICYL